MPPYAPQLRAMVLDQVQAVRRVVEVAADVESSRPWSTVEFARIGSTAASWPTPRPATMPSCGRLASTLPSWIRAHHRKRASVLFDEGRVVRPTALFGIVATLESEGHGTSGCAGPFGRRRRGSSGGAHSHRRPVPSGGVAQRRHTGSTSGRDGDPPVGWSTIIDPSP